MEEKCGKKKKEYNEKKKKKTRHPRDLEVVTI